MRAYTTTNSGLLFFFRSSQALPTVRDSPWGPDADIGLVFDLGPDYIDGFIRSHVPSRLMILLPFCAALIPV